MILSARRSNVDHSLSERCLESSSPQLSRGASARNDTLRQFRWHATGPMPAGIDLRRLGWQALGDTVQPDEAPLCPLLAIPTGLPIIDWFALVGSDQPYRCRVLLFDIADPAERARLLRLGFGDALGPDTSLAEVEARALRVIKFAQSLPRYRLLGQLRLDLLARDAFVARRPVGLNPREFALLWRLSDEPGRAVSPRDLLGDVWRLSFRPVTNSLAVHVSRLRAKLLLAGLDGLVETLPDGAYRLALAGEPPVVPVLDPPNELALDAYLRLGEE